MDTIRSRIDLAIDEVMVGDYETAILLLETCLAPTAKTPGNTPTRNFKCDASDASTTSQAPSEHP